MGKVLEDVAVDYLYKKHRVAAVLTVAVVLAYGALFGVASSAGLLTVFHRLLHVHWVWVPIALAAEVVSYLGYVVAYREVTRAEDGTGLELSGTAAAVATGFGVFVAAGGFALDEAVLKSAGVPAKEARQRVLGLGVLEYVVLAPAAMAAALYIVVNARPDLDEALTFPWIVGVPLGFAAAGALLFFRRRLDLRTGWRRHIAHAVDALSLVRRMVVRPFPYGLAFVGIALYWLGDIACLWAALHVFFQQPPPVALLIVGYATGYALTRRALPLGGAGVVDALLPLSLSWVGIALAPAVLAVLVYRVMNLWLPVIPAFAGLPKLRRLGRHRAHAAV
jgi:uncharacterized membrane protein YbhN (UPF0104 family)